MISLMGCSSNEKNSTPKEETPSNTEDNRKVEQSDNQGEGRILSIGETGVVDSPLGKYEVTLDKVSFHSELDGITPTRGVFALLTVTIENISNNQLDLYAINEPKIFDSRGFDIIISTKLDNEIDALIGELGPNDKITGEILFDTFDSEEYQLVYGDKVKSNEVTWKFPKK